MGQDSWQRARSSEQIELREKQILEAAARLFGHLEYDRVTIQKIAHEAGFTRSNVYRYFCTREEIFLALYLTDGRRWTEDIVKTFTEKMSVSEFVVKWIEVLRRHVRLLELTPLLNLSLERNASRDVYRETKTTFVGLADIMSGAVLAALPSLSGDSVMVFLQSCQMLMAGGWPMGQRTSMQDEVLDELKASAMKIDFFDSLARILPALLKGLGAGD